MREWFQFRKGKGFSLNNFLKNHESAVLVYLNGSNSGGIDKIGLGILEQFEPSDANNFKLLEQFHQKSEDFLFGYFGYDLKNEIEQLTSNNLDNLNFPNIFFFRPVYVLEIGVEYVRIGCYAKDQSGLSKINEAFYNEPIKEAIVFDIGEIKKRITRDTYLENVKKLIDHINRGDVYEVNFCQEFFVEKATIDPVALFNDLVNRTEAPFSSFLQFHHLNLLCASPERFVSKTGSRMITQPIKGTAKRGKTATDDVSIKKALFENKKERSENVMIVDLVRNDLSKNAVNGTVKVDELFGIYTFKTVHQMISTISAELSPEVSKMEALEGLFPPGSMTGAPKVSAMQLIEKYEQTKRGLYAGSVGYFTPNGDFDFNVVIRSIMYNAQNKYLSFITGGAITAYCDPKKEYEECLLKAEALIACLKSFRRTQ